MAHDQVVKALVVQTSGFEGAKSALPFIIRAESDFCRGAMKNLPIPGGIAFFPEKIADADPLFDGQGKGVLSFSVTSLHLLKTQQGDHRIYSPRPFSGNRTFSSPFLMIW
jgi:hypothetical protein